MEPPMRTSGPVISSDWLGHSSGTAGPRDPNVASCNSLTMDQGEQPHKRQKFSVPKACQGCKTRKIRCDRTIPCSNCRTAGVDCQEAETIREKRPTAAETNDLRDYVVSLESRLQAVEAKLNSHDRSSQHLGSQQHTSTPGSNPGVVSISDTPIDLYEGESSFTRQSLGAREAVESMANPSAPGAGSNLNIAFDSLSGLLKPVQQSGQAEEGSTRDSVQMPLCLPAELVLTLLRRFREQTPLFLSSYPINDLALLEKLCQRVYFPIRDVSAGDVAAMHGVFYWLIRELLSRNDEFCKKFDLATHFKNCKSSFEADLRSHSLFTAPSFENIIALAMGTLKAQDEADPLTGCHMISTAVRYCQMLGYHRESTFKNSKDENSSSKRRVFWTIYVFDKTMSLLLGRASYLQDFDMDVKPPAPSSDPKICPWDEAFCSMIELAGIQGDTYNKLYSPSAMKHSSSERLKDIKRLKLAIEECKRGRDKIDYSKADQPQIHELSLKTWDILYYSVLTSILRAYTSTEDGEIGHECFTAARMCLLSHLECFPGYADSGLVTVADYANWVQLYSSFTPFIVIFLHSIAATSLEDVKLLEQVVETVQKTRGVSKASERLYNICANFLSVSRGLVGAQKSCVGRYDGNRDALELTNDSQDGHYFPTDLQQDDIGLDMTRYLTYPEAQSMSALLECWDSGQPSAMDLLGMDTEYIQ